MSAVLAVDEQEEETARVVRPVLVDVLRSVDPVQMMLANGKRPDPWQPAAIRERKKNLILLCSRQAGKSEVAICRSSHSSLYRPPSLTLILSASERQATELLKRLRAFIAPFEARWPLKKDAATELEWDCGSRVVSLPASPSTIRGYAAADEVILDESQEIPGEVYKTVRPIIAISRGRLTVLGTAKWEQGWFWEEFTKGGTVDQDAALSLNDGWHRVVADASQCPRFTKTFLDAERETMGEDFFLAEYGCRFRKAALDPGEAPFSPETVEATFQRKTGKPLQFGGKRKS